MRFAFTEDQLALRDAVRDLLGKECPPEVVRAAWPDGTDEGGARKGDGARADTERLDRVWSALAGMGVLGVAVPEAAGGLGFDPVDWVLVAEETGYAALPHPFVDTALVTAPFLAAVGDPDGVLSSLVDGSRTAAVLPLGSRMVPWGDAVTFLLALGVEAVDAPSGAAGDPVTVDERPAGDGRSTGAPSGDPGGGLDGLAERPPTDPGGALGGDGPPNHHGIHAGSAPMWTARRIEAGVAHGDARALALALDAGRRTVLLEGWRASAPLGSSADAAAAFDRGALAVAAQLVGLARRMVEMTVGYVAERRQFGVPIGSFQAVKHHLADAALGIEFAAPVVYGAAWSLTHGVDTGSRDVSAAKALASDAARAAGRAALQCHGAIGYTTEYDLHLYLKRAEVLARAWGDAAWHRDRVASALDLSPGPAPAPPVRSVERPPPF